MRVLLLILTVSLLGCQKEFHLINTYDVEDKLESIDLNAYDLYSYSICANNTDEKGITAIYNCTTDDERTNTIEEIYLLYPKNDSLKNRVILLSTLSYVKNPQREYSRPIYQNNMDLSDVDFIFIGRLKQDTIVFSANKKKDDLQWQIDRTGDEIEVVSVPYFERRKGDPERLLVREVLQGGVTFKKQNRKVAFQYRWKKPQKNCLLDDTILTCDSITISKINNRDKVIFSLNNTTNCEAYNHVSFRNRRLWYYDIDVE